MNRNITKSLTNLLFVTIKPALWSIIGHGSFEPFLLRINLSAVKTIQ